MPARSAASGGAGRGADMHEEVGAHAGEPFAVGRAEHEQAEGARGVRARRAIMTVDLDLIRLQPVHVF